MKGLWLALALAAVPVAAAAEPAEAPCRGAVAVCDGVSDASSDFPLIRDGKPATVYVDADAAKPVLRVAEDFAADLERVSGVRPAVVHDLKDAGPNVVVIAQAGNSALLVELENRRIADPRELAAQPESYQQSVFTDADGRHYLLIAGNGPRGAIYGAYDLSAKIGVSPWYWWADVPVGHRDNLYVTSGVVSDYPRVAYRGFFINDEEPAFGGWAREKFGGIHHDLYGHVFELALRLKGNYIWPAMWGKAFAADDPLNPQTAADYGIIMGTSHHEPMTRAQDEWHRDTDTGITGGAWDYTKNVDNLRAFWRGGIERMQAGHFENIVTVGMRGDGDEPMSEGTATHLLETIVADQRRIIADVTGKPASETPQVWALYKEVQDYYDHGMTVPDDVTLLFSDDNWGQIRRLPDPAALKQRSGSATEMLPKRAGGYGIYYHFDYVGGPRNYKWLNTNQIEKVWQQMDLAYESGADRLWIVNVGDIKPMEFPLSFFMDMAWNPEAMTPEALEAYPAKWAGQQFGRTRAQGVGVTLTRYGQLSSRIKPELLNAQNVDTTDHADWGRLLDMANLQKAGLDPAYNEAWFQLIQYPIEAQYTLRELYAAVAENSVYAGMGAANANEWADKAEQAFGKDSRLGSFYNHDLSGGKWNHMMDQTHIGYTGWQQPDVQVMPEVKRNNSDRIFEELQRVAYRQPPSHRTGGQPPDISAGIPTASYGEYIAIEAEHFSRKTESEGVHWQIIPNLGRTLSSVISLPQAAAPTTDSSVKLEYDFGLWQDTGATLYLYLAPTLDTQAKGGLRLAVAMDDNAPQVLTFDLKPDTPEWNRAVSDNIVVLKAALPGLKAGNHTIRVFRIDGNVVLQRLVLDTGGLLPSWLGPPETPVSR